MAGTPRADTYWLGEPKPAPTREVGDQGRYTIQPKEGAEPAPNSECGPIPVRFVRNEITLPAGPNPDGITLVSLTPQAGVLYPGLHVRFGTPYEWLLREGILNVAVTVNDKTPYPIGVRNANPRDPILLPQCYKNGETIKVRVFWADATLTGNTPIPFWGEIAFGSEEPPTFDDDSRNRVRRRLAFVPITVLPGAAFASVSPAVIRPTAGQVSLQQSPATAGNNHVQYTFAVAPGGGPGNIAGHIASLAPLFSGVTFENRDLRDLFLGDPLAVLTAPTTVFIHREVW